MIIQCHCPECKTSFNSITKVRCYPTPTADWGDSVAINAVLFACPSCGCCLGVVPDPVSMRKDTAREVVRQLGKTR